MAISSISVVNNSTSYPIAVNSPYYILFDVTYSGDIPSSLPVAISVDGVNYYKLYRATPFSDISLTVRRFRFRCDEILRGYMDEFEEETQSNETLLFLEKFSKRFWIKGYDDTETYSAIFEAVFAIAARQFGENPIMTNINDQKTYLAARGKPCYVYFFNNSTYNTILVNTPIPPPTDYWTLTINVSGDGTVSKDPDLASYEDGSEVGVSALANAGSEFAFFMPDDATAIGDLEYDNPLTVLMDADKTKTAYFALDELDYVFDASSGADWVLGSFWNNPDGYPLKYECDFQADGVLITVTNVSESDQIAYILDFELRRNIVASYLGVYFDIVTTGSFGVGLGITNSDNGYNLLRKETEILYSTDEPSKLIAITPQTLANRIFLYSYSMVISPSASVKFKISRIRLSKTAFTL